MGARYVIASIVAAIVTDYAYEQVKAKTGIQYRLNKHRCNKLESKLVKRGYNELIAQRIKEKNQAATDLVATLNQVANAKAVAV